VVERRAGISFQESEADVMSDLNRRVTVLSLLESKDSPARREFVEKWCKDLESGRHMQGRDALAQERNDGKVEYCCLGRACEIAIQEGLGSLERRREEDGVFCYDGEEWELPSALADKLGLETDPIVILDEALLSEVPYVYPILYPNGPTVTFLNDTCEMSFEEIAKVLRKTYLT
jgi:hypothetical protein